jgi:hypothetical protein
MKITSELNWKKTNKAILCNIGWTHITVNQAMSASISLGDIIHDHFIYTTYSNCLISTGNVRSCFIKEVLKIGTALMYTLYEPISFKVRGRLTDRGKIRVQAWVIKILIIL